MSIITNASKFTWAPGDVTMAATVDNVERYFKTYDGKIWETTSSKALGHVTHRRVTTQRGLALVGYIVAAAKETNV